MRIIFLHLFILFSCVVTAQQTASVRGRVFTEDNKPAPYITITLQHLQYATETNKDGVFILNNLPALHDTLIISGVGFETIRKAISLNASEALDAGNLHLIYNVNELQHIEITGRIKRSYKSDYSFAATKTQTPLAQIPQTVSTVTKELINDKLQQHLNSALDNVAGVTRYSGYEEYTIRGMRAENPHLINGLRIFNTKLTSPMLVNVERVEVLKGPSSILYGNQDPGGTINIVTKKPLSEKKYFIAAGAGSWNAYNIQGDATGPLNKNKTWLYRVNAGYENTNSFRNNVFLKSYQLAPSLTFIPNDKLRLNLDVAYTDVKSVADRGQPSFENDKSFTSTPASLSVIQPGDYLKEKTISTELFATYNFNKHFSFSSGYLNYITKQMLSEHGLKDFISNDSVNLYYAYRQVNTSTNTFTNYATAEFNTGAVKHQLLAGFDIILADLKSNQYNGVLPGTDEDEGIAGTFSLAHPFYFKRPVNTYNHIEPPDEGEDDDDDGKYNTHGFYVQEELKWKRWFLQAALRAEFYNSGGGEEGEEDEEITREKKLMPCLGVTYMLHNNVHVYGVYKEGFDPFETSTAVQYFDTTFKPITSHMIEFGGKTELFNKQLFASLSVYQILITNVAVNANDPENPNLFVQRGEQRSRGIEAEAEGSLFSHLNIAFGYAYNLTKISKSVKPEEVGTIAENAPRNSSNSWLKYSVNKNVAIAFGHNQVSKRNTLVAGTTLPGYTILNCGLYYTYRHFLFSGVLNNITDKKYYLSAYNSQNKWPGAPRNFMLRLGYSF